MFSPKKHERFREFCRMMNAGHEVLHLYQHDDVLFCSTKFPPQKHKWFSVFFLETRQVVDWFSDIVFWKNLACNISHRTLVFEFFQLGVLQGLRSSPSCEVCDLCGEGGPRPVHRIGAKHGARWPARGIPHSLLARFKYSARPKETSNLLEVRFEKNKSSEKYSSEKSSLSTC